MVAFHVKKLKVRFIEQVSMKQRKRIWGKMRGIIDLASGGEGRVWMENRDTPGIGDQKWLAGF